MEKDVTESDIFFISFICFTKDCRKNSKKKLFKVLSSQVTTKQNKNKIAARIHHPVLMVLGNVERSNFEDLEGNLL